MTETLLFSPMTIRGVTLKNRIVVPPMHQYPAEKGFPTDVEGPFRNVPPQFGYCLGTRAKRGFGTQSSTWQNGLHEDGKATSNP